MEINSSEGGYELMIDCGNIFIKGQLISEEKLTLNRGDFVSLYGRLDIEIM